MAGSASEMQTLVSVIICTYNGEKYLEKTLRTVYRQTYKNLEILIIDDGSKDCTRDIIRKAQKEDPRVRAVFQENQGLAMARNNAFSAAKGEWLAVIDQDDLCYPERMEEQLRHARKHPEASLIFCDTDYIDENDAVIGSHLSHFHLPGPDIKKGQAADLLLRQGCYIDSESVFLNKKAFEKAGPLDKKLTYACDYEYFVRLGTLYGFSYVDKKLGAWRIHPGQETKKNKNKEKEQNAVYLKYLFHAGVSMGTRIRLAIKIAKYAVKRFATRRNGSR